MDAVQRLWQDDYRREVDEVIARMRADGTRSPRPIDSLIDAVLPPAGLVEDLRQARERLASLEKQLEDARGLLAVSAADLQRERSRRERLKQLVTKLHWTSGRVEAERRAAVEKSAETSARLAELSESLRESSAAALDAGALAEQERARALQRAQEVRALQARVDEMQLALDRRQAACESAERRLEAATAAHEQRAGESERQARGLEERLAAALREREDFAESVAAERASSREALSASKREAHAARDEAAALAARLQQALSELRSGPALEASIAQLQHQVQGLEADLDKTRSRLKDSLVEASHAATQAAQYKKDADAAAEAVGKVKEEAAQETERLLSQAAVQLTRIRAEADEQLSLARAEAAEQLAQARAQAAEQLAQARAEVSGQVSQAKAVSDRRLDAVLSEDAALDKELSELRGAHERDRQKIIEDCSQALDRVKLFASSRSAPAAPSAPAEKPGLLARLFGAGK